MIIKTNKSYGRFKEKSLNLILDPDILFRFLRKKEVFEHRIITWIDKNNSHCFPLVAEHIPDTIVVIEKDMLGFLVSERLNQKLCFAFPIEWYTQRENWRLVFDITYAWGRHHCIFQRTIETWKWLKGF